MKKTLAIILTATLMLSFQITSVFADDSTNEQANANLDVQGENLDAAALDENNSGAAANPEDNDGTVTPAEADNAVAAVQITEDNFPDEIFRNYVSKNFDSDNDGYLSSEEISKATKVDLNGTDNLESLKGIEYLTVLTVQERLLSRIMMKTLLRAMVVMSRC